MRETKNEKNWLLENKFLKPTHDSTIKPTHDSTIKVWVNSLTNLMCVHLLGCHPLSLHLHAAWSRCLSVCVSWPQRTCVPARSGPFACSG